MARLKPPAFFLFAVLSLATAPLHADLLVKPHDVVLVAAETPMMQGWVSVDIAQYFAMCAPVDGLEVVGACDGEEEADPFLSRIDPDIAFWHPTVALISHGGNDGHSDTKSDGFIQGHARVLGMTLDKLKQLGVGTILLGTTSPVDSTLFPDSADAAKTWNANLANVVAQDHDIATKAGVNFVDIFNPMMDAMTKAKAANGDKYVFGGSRGRFLDRNAQLVMAYAFLKALGCDGNIGTITVDMTANTATGTPGQKIISDQNGTVQVESTRYPYCFQGDPQTSDATSGIISFFPFNDDLNRYLLVVSGLTGTNAKVTWGTESREFAVADLAKGVNLAAAFASHTPFDSQFMRVEDALWQQQLKQWIYMTTIVHNLGEYKEMAPDGNYDQLVAGIYDQDHKNGAAAAALIIPIQHTLKIEAMP